MKQKTFTRWVVLVAIWCATIATSFAQTGRIAGKITDDKKQPVMGATIIVAGSTQGAASDMDGNYVIEDVKVGEVKVQTSYIGFESQDATLQVKAGKTTAYDLQLGENKELLGEVVITGYGQTQQRRDLTGAIAKVDSKTLSGQPVQSFDQALQGNASGVQVTQGSGVAGSASLIRIRGASTVSAGGDPLYVVDGIPITQDYFLTGGTRGNQNYNPLSSINPNDIESIEVLKDAAASAIYGSRGANGVILITTKRGKGNKDNKPKFNFSTRMGWGEPTRVVKFLDNKQLLNTWQKAWENDGKTGRAPLPEYYTSQGYTYADAENTNNKWTDMMLQKGFKQEYNLSMNNLSKNGVLGTYIGTSYSNNNSYIIGNNQERTSVRANFDIRPFKNMTIALSTSLARNVINRDGTDDFWSGWIGTQAYYLPFYPTKDKTGEYFGFVRNPLAQREHNKLQNVELRSINSLNLSYNLTPELALNVSGNYDFLNNSDHLFQDSIWRTRTNPNGTGDDRKGYTREYNTIGNNFNTYGTLVYNFKKVLPKEHSLTAMVGSEYQQRTTGKRSIGFVGLKGWTYNSNMSDTLNGTAKKTFDSKGSYGETDSTKFFSLFARVNYSYKDKYQAQVTFRRDGSSAFGSERRFGNFPSVGLGWVISEEPFFRAAKKTVNFMKLRASWGITGNAAIPWYQQYGGFSENTGGLNPGATYNGNLTASSYKKANNTLQWETKQTIDAGLQFGLLDDRIVVDFGAYRSISEHVFLQVTQAPSSGLNEDYFNLGAIRNQGLELSVTSRNVVSKRQGGFQWTTVLNLSSNDHKLTNTGGYQPDALRAFFGDLRPVEGYYVATHYKVRMDHIDPATGLPVYLDAKGNETSTYSPETSRVPLGGVLPYLTGGMNNRFEYKGFDFSFQWVLSLGGKVYDDAAKRQRWILSNDGIGLSLNGKGDGFWNMRADMLENRWTEQNPDNAAYPILSWDPQKLGMKAGNAGYWQNNTSAFLEDASYARLRNVTLGYNIPLKKGADITAMRLYFVGANLYTITKYSGWDVEVARETDSAGGRNVGGANNTFLTAPQEKSFMFGLDLTF